MDKEQRAQQVSLILGIVKMTGALFILASIALWFNMAGLSDMLGVNDGTVNRILAGALFAVGVADFLIIPKILAKALGADQAR